MEDKKIRAICQKHRLQCNNIVKVFGSFDKELYIADEKYLIRTSLKPMHDEQMKIDRISNLKKVPKIYYASDHSNAHNEMHYLIVDYIKGSELFSAYGSLNDQDIQTIGVDIARFLADLHSIKGEKYDIGHYIPIFANYDGSWRSGHEQYWNYIYNKLKSLDLMSDFLQVIELCNEYINENIASLEFASGPCLLHNDFHYKNIVINNNTLSGVIDWECSQYGEADFDLIHLLHWSIFPPTQYNDMKNLFSTIFSYQMKNSNIPMIDKRLTIYLLEHDCIQTLWSKGKRAEQYLPRLKWWVSGELEDYILSLG